LDAFTGGAVITVTMPAYKCLSDIEALLVDGGMPPITQRDGFIKSWFDPSTDTMTFVYTPIEEARKSVTTIKDQMQQLRDFSSPAGSYEQQACDWAVTEIERLRIDAARYRFLRDTFFTRDVDVPPGFTGDVIIAPPRTETFEHGIPITKDWAHSWHLDAAIDAALNGKTAGLYVLLKDAS
jgi:hypothetical protein